MNSFNKIIRSLFNTRAASLYIVLFALSIGVATFIENDFGTSAAQKVVFKAWWFELLLILFSCSLIANIIWFKMIKQRKWAMILFHASMVIIIIGAGFTRYFGYEGNMHIREGDKSNVFISTENYINLKANTEANHYEINKEFLVSSLGSNHFNEDFLIEGNNINVELKSIVPNPVESVVEKIGAAPMLKVVVAVNGEREEHFIREGEVKRIGREVFNFTEQELANTHHIVYAGDSLSIKPLRELTSMVMATQQIDSLNPEAGYYGLKLRALYSGGGGNFVFPEFIKDSDITYVSEAKKLDGSSSIGFNFDVSLDGQTESLFVIGRPSSPGKSVVTNINGVEISLAYGAIHKILPFSIELVDFEMERYPGTNSSASYASDVILFDSRNGNTFDYRIFMNNILDYEGYRFFQSSFDQDEKGTYLSVNHDALGTWVSYLGYFLLTLGFVLSLFSKNSRLHDLHRKIKTLRKSAAAILIIAFGLTVNSASAQQQILPDLEVVSADHADQFSLLIVQDFKGRMKPVHTLSREILRKIHGSETYHGHNADQVLLSVFASSRTWVGAPIVKIGEHTGELISVEGKYASYQDFFTKTGDYKLYDEIKKIYDIKAKDRNAGHKELIKVDERLNIVGMLFSGSLLRIVPVDGDVNNTWVSFSNNPEETKSKIADKFFLQYQASLQSALNSNDYTVANKLLTELNAYQQKVGKSIIPSATKMKTEIFLNNTHVFNKLSLYYLFLGLFYLILLFVSVFKPKLNLSLILKITTALVFLGFLTHTLGLGMRWYVSGRAPWSNGYESMIYIAWTTTLAGVIFTRKSIGGLAATMILASTVLLIAMLSYLDPEITPLAPVLKSYWLTIHVSLEAGSYGFLLLGAIIGLLNLLLMVFLTDKNKDHLKRVITEMSHISEMTLIGGLFMLSVGTYLGGVWANESWGRYWGWDAKETWALVSILVYAFILHMRLVPGLRGLFAFNLATLFGLSSIIMTYFGVNYYLSGLHSYAAGDPIPVPTWVYVVAVSFMIIGILASRKRKLIK